MKHPATRVPTSGFRGEGSNLQHPIRDPVSGCVNGVIPAQRVRTRHPATPFPMSLFNAYSTTLRRQPRGSPLTRQSEDAATPRRPLSRLVHRAQSLLGTRIHLNLQSTHCLAAPTFTGRWHSPRRDGQWWRVWSCLGHLEGLTAVREFGRRGDKEGCRPSPVRGPAPAMATTQSCRSCRSCPITGRTGWHRRVQQCEAARRSR